MELCRGNPTKSAKILIVQDEPALEYNLSHQGYSVRVVGDGRQAIEAARDFNPDLVLLDVMLPGLDGFEVCRILRRETNVPILMLTARDSEIDRVIGLEIGADDYITKPFSMRELQARLKALLRRVRLDQEDAAPERPGGAGPENLSFGDLTLDLDRHELTRAGPARVDGRYRGGGILDRGSAGGGQFFHARRQLQVERADHIAEIMRDQVDRHPVVDIGPFRVVVHFVRFDACADHPAEGGGERFEFKLFVQLPVDHLPAGEVAQGLFDFFCRGDGASGHGISS